MPSAFRRLDRNSSLLLSALAVAGTMGACSSSSSSDAPADSSTITDAGADATNDVAADDTSTTDTVTSDAACVPFRPPGSCPIDPATGLPTDLACTGLYGDFAARTIACDVHEFAPGHQLWSDGAHKRRWIQLPPGATIDASDPNEWTFPVGTKIWKEFRIDAPGSSTPVLVETRLFTKTPEVGGTWHWTTYVWSDDASKATSLTTGKTNVRGTTYEIPSHEACIGCHGGRADRVLGFDAVLMSAPTATGLVFSELVKQKLLTGMTAAPTIPGNDVERAALGYLHANCGVACHNPTATSGAALSGLHLRIEADVTDVKSTNAFKTGLNKTPGNNFPGQPPPPSSGKWYDVRPTDVARSLVVARMSIRDAPTGKAQMPPIVTHAKDDDGIRIVSAWIASMTTANGYPAPSP